MTNEQKFTEIMRSRGFDVKPGPKVVCASFGVLKTVLAIAKRHNLSVIKQSYTPNLHTVQLAKEVPNKKGH